MKIYIVTYWNNDCTPAPEVKGAFEDRQKAIGLSLKLFNEEIKKISADRCHRDRKSGFCRWEDDTHRITTNVVETELTK